MKVCMIIFTLVGSLCAIDVPVLRRCNKQHPAVALASNYHENIGHAIHSMTVEGLRLFNPRATAKNAVPTVNLNVSSPMKVIPYAPEDNTDSDYATPTMNRIDKILNNIGMANDGLGAFWNPTERIAHYFHMLDLWVRIRQVYGEVISVSSPSQDVCDCLCDVENNGIYASVKWVADHYMSGTPITLLDKPIPKLVDAKSWAVWKDRLLHYYDASALHDAALYLFCATKDL